MAYVVLFLILSVIANIVGIFFIRNAMIKTESYDDFFEETQNRIQATINTMKAIDTRGAFQADDEVGSVFQQMSALVQSLEVFLLDTGTKEPDAKKE